MDHYASDIALLIEYLELKSAIHIGPFTEGGEVDRHVARYGQSRKRVAKTVLSNAVELFMLKNKAQR
ncbi:hypothetical protein [Gluconobacter kanchanaburiensis]|uniref:Uncharacterized protein n=1 Tax=Gluconobacter kanchanaburiensis NBRC 103587 TaxID=1307948 RepID=A0A511B9D9_9PROT|nr:hypothetical protein [Gluconobacter kanchanaburiensis]GBR67455.1 hypothetical protein AA103587_0292 [Gluconobacter kanchanaburiensis NBRC 103587]GEK96924.1 hypothetical protein GKA01_21210 [Gluconobacter kanchanaburiensis NBRC 103587]